MAHDIFISHSSSDKQKADDICRTLEQNGIKCWIAPRDIPAGASYGGEIIKGIKDCKAFLLIFSKEANSSPAVAKEVERAVLGYNKKVITYRLENAELGENLEFFLTDVHWLDALPDDGTYNNLITAVNNSPGMTAKNYSGNQGNPGNKEAVITLTLKNAESKTFTLAGQQKELTLGRSQNCRIFINDPSVSNNHGRFYWENGKLFYADLNSTNGSFINGAQVAAGQAAQLHDGAVISIAGAHSAINLTVSVSDEISSGTDGTGNPNEDKTLLIGRDQSCDIVLPNQNVSRFHAKLFTRGGKFYIEDNHSTNGTFVNGARLEKPCVITSKDDIYVASVRMRLKNGVLTPEEEREGLSVQVFDLYREVTEKGSPKVLLDHISLSIESNEFVAIIGGSGAGKSTFMNVLCGKTETYNGVVAFNRSSAVDSRSIFKSVVGFAPQNDVLYRDLTLHQMLFYSAKLKMPQDTRPEEYEDRVKSVIQKVELTGHENTPVRRLSGGQQKRASIAVELLSDPKLFFLDEPTSGLDPATERKLMRMLKEMTKDNKTIVAVTHVTQNLNLCDKVIVLGKGGKLCFFGTPQETCEYFEVTDIVDIYDKINDNPEMWQKKYKERTAESGVNENPPELSAQNQSKKQAKSGYNSGLSQFTVLTARYLRLTFGDFKRCMLLFLQAPILGFLLMLVSNSSSSDGVFTYSSNAQSMLFSLTCAAFWVGMLNSIQEICKERDIYEREKMSTVRLLPYMASKITVVGLLCVFQAFVLILVVHIMSGGLPANDSIGVSPFLGYFITTCLTTVSAGFLGLAVSSLSPNADRAMAIAPLILLPQILLSGVVFKLADFMEYISNIIPCKLAMQNYGILTNLNTLPFSSDTSDVNLETMYKLTDVAGNSNLFGTWRGLIISSLVYIIIFTTAVRLQSKD